MQGKPTDEQAEPKGAWWFDKFGREGSEKDPAYYAICEPHAEGSNQASVIVDTLNCDHLTTLEEQEKYCERIVTAVNERPVLIARLATYEAALRECAALSSQNPAYRPDIQFREIENIARKALEDNK